MTSSAKTSSARCWLKAWRQKMPGGGGAEAALSYYRRCSQASRKGRMFDDLLHEARQWVRFRSCSGGRRKAARSRQGSLL
ncbi:hypothetical protein F3I27_23185 [Pantoea sp. Bo_2]|nr:hypothetical protein F3I56_23160 [Pantoea sp. VH_25]KAA6039305.1 hypothetical protein F3I36_23425 [Pantoea sp. FN_2b]KAA6044172.1 hypothetical protein F3I34_23195 [Pantoea sp. Bo_5]KAA6053099.1 hypothetical protein F3I32_23520 [Pantoea sp. Bo_40]KAA6053150.1 hypothetical protein F3I33_23190 [Pantoea sp. Bo_46]KAA6057105.1 hypothetical protein F3I29_23220 [Pantoea sp. Bo_3]KAA6066638.1 hypothetical protein F3I28_23200 [Pantoea sp. Bo_21]KAA6067484.1 hypothetical protein F3I27_23185 [Pantoe